MASAARVTGMKISEVVWIECHLVGMICWCDIPGITSCRDPEEGIRQEEENSRCSFVGVVEQSPCWWEKQVF
jgi:hypothetical protein